MIEYGVQHPKCEKQSIILHWIAKRFSTQLSSHSKGDKYYRFVSSSFFCWLKSIPFNVIGYNVFICSSSILWALYPEPPFDLPRELNDQNGTKEL